MSEAFCRATVRQAMAKRGACAVALLALVLTSACAHQTTITTSAPGATVVVEGEEIGRTPVEYVESTGHQGEVYVDVRQDGVSKRFAVARDQVDGRALVGSLGLAAALAAGSSFFLIVSSGAMVAGVAVAAVNPILGVAILGGSLVGVALATMVANTGILLPIVMFSETGYALPSRVDVDWESGAVLTDSGGGVRDLVGVHEGFTPHPGQKEGAE